MLRPERPIRRRRLSITKATRAMYPLSSSIERKKNRIRMTGRKLTTVPTPSKIPSRIRLWMTGFTAAASIPLRVRSAKASIPLCRRSWKKGPTRKKVR